MSERTTQSSRSGSRDGGATRRHLIPWVLAVLGGTTSAWAGGLASGPIGRLSGELTITGDDGVRQAVVTAATNYSPSTRTGTAVTNIRRGDARLAHATADFTADTGDAALGGVTALVMAVTGQSPGRSSLKLSNVRFDGDSRSFALHAGRLMDWWDDEAGLAVDTYLSPRPGLANLGKLQLNVWGTTGGGSPERHFLTVLFDPADVTKVVGGTYNGVADVIGGSLLPITGTTDPTDFLLEVELQLSGGTPKATFVVAIDTLADGTIDVRGSTNHTFGVSGTFTVEGVGNAKFVVPGQ